MSPDFEWLKSKNSEKIPGNSRNNKLKNTEFAAKPHLAVLRLEMLLWARVKRTSITLIEIVFPLQILSDLNYSNSP